MIRFAAAIATAALLAAPATAAEKRFAVGGFDRIDLGGSPDVTVTTGRAVSVVALGDQTAIDRLDIRVEKGALVIGRKRGIRMGIWNGDKVRIAVTVPMVRGVAVGGSGSVTVDRVKVPAFVADVGGSGTIRVAALDTGTAKFAVGGSGAIDAAGRCDSGSASIGGSGTLRLGGLKCATLDVDVGGSGDVDAYASRTATVSLAGSGDVRIAGGASCKTSKYGSGSVRCGA